MDFDRFKVDTAECFKQLKGSLNSLCRNIGNINKTNPILQESNIFKDENEIEDISKNLDMNIDMITRDKMKCVFFGKTSNGKSATVNAILGQEILPSCIGRTTSCFISIEGSSDSSPYIIDGKGQRRSINDINDIANELNDKDGNIDSVIKLYWPKRSCEFLQTEIQLLDSPGVDYSPKNNVWIEAHCRDADAFVYVVDGCATINESERTFFRRVKYLLKTPNIIILFNKWDHCKRDNSPSDLEKLKNQHRETADKFLNQDLKLQCNVDERLFFVSSTEALECAILNESTEEIGEFMEFVRFLQEQLSKNALVTKFKPHVYKGIEYIEKVLEILDRLRCTQRDECSQMQPSALKHIIGVLIKDTFKHIRERAISEIEIQYPQLCPAMVKGQNADFYENVAAQYSEKIIVKVLQETLRGKIEELSQNIKHELAKYSRHEIPITTLDQYESLAFTEYIVAFEKDLPGQVFVTTSKLKNPTVKKDQNSGFFGFSKSALTKITSIITLNIFKKHNPANHEMAMAIASGINETVANEERDKEMKREVREVPENYLKPLIIQSIMEFVNQTERDIENCANGTVGQFVDDANEINKVLQEFYFTKKELLKTKDKLEIAKKNLEEIK